ncbi:Plasmodium exported protein, unknown function [Plasmodium gonderi]|uniref:Uncharacterized protein n=1 Tax=Plasmodium gonderi TaxID=77519 RepID=A0A1Y1JIT9_PLAGO|nr:Plasmodium exported protein, unknown function [Plasmodium gonderi]GAW81558.1 Plasmodium exported protein, unknown function [Plasmodium gonderi]
MDNSLNSKNKRKKKYLITEPRENTKRDPTRTRIKLLHTYLKVFSFTLLIYLLHNFNCDVNNNTRGYQHNSETRKDITNGRQLTTHIHNHCGETPLLGGCELRNSTSINKYKRECGWDFPFDRCRSSFGRMHHHNTLLPNATCTTTVHTTNTNCLNGVPYGIAPPCGTQYNYTQTHHHHHTPYIAPPVCEPNYSMAMAVIDDTIHSALSVNPAPCGRFGFGGCGGFRTRYINPLLTSFYRLPIYARGGISLLLLLIPIAVALIFIFIVMG